MNMRSYRFGEFILEVQERRLRRDGEAVALTPKVFDTLVYLVEHHGHLVGKDELIQAVWNDSHVEDGNLPRTIHILRKALGNGDNDTKHIETVPTKGYRFVAEITFVEQQSADCGPLIPQPELERTGRPRHWPRLIAAAMAGLLSLMLIAITFSKRHQASPQEGSALPQTLHGAAYVKYQTGRLHMERQHPGDYAEALRNFEDAITLDPNFGVAYAGKADAKPFLYWATGSHDDIAQARIAALKAIELDPSSSYARTMLCRIRATYDWDFRGAESECRRAVELDPRNSEARRELAFVLSSIGKREDALEQMNTAVALAPTSFNKRSRGLLLYFSRNLDQAIEQFKQVESTDPEYSESSRWIARAFEQKKDYPHALEFLIRYRESEGAGSNEIELLRHSFATGGWPEVLRSSIPQGHSRPSLEHAGTFAQLGENDKAFEILERMITDRRVMVVQMDNDPRLDPLRSDPRFELIAKRVGVR